MSRPDIERRINELLGKLYGPDEAAMWWSLPQPLLDDKTPEELKAAGRLDAALNILECLEAGAYL